MSQFGKVKSFSLSSKNKKDLEKQKKLAEEEAAAEAYEQFVATFEAPKQTAKLFVRGTVINPASGKEIDVQQSGKLYKPDKLEEFEKRNNKKHEVKKSEEKKSTKSFNYNEKPPKKKGDVKKKSNLEMFKEELKMIQEEREERHRMRNQTKDKLYKPSAEDELESRKYGGSHDTGDPNTTNIYLGNLNPKLSETQLCEIFGRYGPLASVKIMWPRTDEERVRNRNCGFVAFMCRKDGERALKAINGRMVMDYEMRLGWGKAVPIPTNPVYVPAALRELTMPPPASGLPFNAQVVDEYDKQLLKKYGDPQRLFREDKETFDQILSRTVVKVVIPSERALLALIHRVIEFVVREGPMFEALLMSREASNPMFSFLFDCQSPAHVYYRWRLFSVLQGDHPTRWRTKEFRMFKDGSIWKPPPINLYLQGMPVELLPKDSEFKFKDDRSRSPDDFDSDSDHYSSRNSRSEHKRGNLNGRDREDLEDMLRSLTPQRSKIAELMVFCIDHSDSSDEIVECITDSLCIVDTPHFKKIARLYLVSDILHNCSVKVANVSNYRKGFQAKMVSIFESFNQAYNQIEGRLKAEHFKQKIMTCFRAWEETAIYALDFLLKLQNIFLGLSPNKDNKLTNLSPVTQSKEDIDGVPINDPDLDGEEMPDFPSEDPDTFSTKFKPSKWETIDPDVVQSQAITSKWENLDKSAAIFAEDEEDIDGKPMEEEADYFETLISNKSNTVKSTSSNNNNNSNNSESSLSREVLRQIELQVVKYQDELELDIRNGRRRLDSTETPSMLVERYRAELLRKASNTSDADSHRERKGSFNLSKRSRSRSPKSRSHHHFNNKRHASRSPTGRSSSRSRSPANKWRK